MSERKWVDARRRPVNERGERIMPAAGRCSAAYQAYYDKHRPALVAAATGQVSPAQLVGEVHGLRQLAEALRDAGEREEALSEVAEMEDALAGSRAPDPHGAAYREASRLIAVANADPTIASGARRRLSELATQASPRERGAILRMNGFLSRLAGPGSTPDTPAEPDPPADARAGR